jgi:serine/threonine protein kinase
MGSPVDLVSEPGPEESSSSNCAAPRSLGEYRLLKRLGSGGMGQVYKAMHLRLEKLVAIKLLPEYKAGDARALARFDREIKAAGRVNHPNVVQALDAREIDGTRFLVMELVDGVNLSQLVRTCGRLEIADACELTRQAALGLQAAHQHGLVHRDIKPSNLMLSRSGQLKILDLGLARFRAEPAEPGEVTEVGETIGTAEYIAPEQVADSHRVDIRADIYSLGCSMFRLLTGQPPFYGAKYHSAVEKMVAHLKEELPSVRELRSEVSEPLETIVTKMVAKDPDQRYSTPAEVAAAIAPLAAGSDLPRLMSKYDAACKGAAVTEPSSSSEKAPLSLGKHTPDTSPATPLLDRQSAEINPPSKSNVAKAWTIAVTAIVLITLAFVAVSKIRKGVVPTPEITPENTAQAPNKLSTSADDLYGKELPNNKWIDVLPYTDVDRDRVSDLWEVRKDGIGCKGTNGYPRISLPVAVHGDYDLELEFTRNSGEGLIRILTPVGDKNLAQTLLAAGNGRLYGFNEFNGHGLADNGNPSATRTKPLNNGERYTVRTGIRLHGDESTVDVTLNGEPLVHSISPASAFPRSHSEDPNSGARPIVGVEAGSDVTFHAARIRPSGSKSAVKERRPTEACANGKWVDLLPHVDLARDRIAGDFSWNGKELVMHKSGLQGALMLPAAVLGSYELQFDFAHSPSRAMISFIIPVGSRRVRVNPTILGKARPDAPTINRAAPNGVRVQPAISGFEEGIRHALTLKVNVDGPKASIEMQSDGQQCISWSGDLEELHDGPILLPEGDRIGLVANGSLTVYAARLRVNSGKGAVVVKEPPK